MRSHRCRHYFVSFHIAGSRRYCVGVSSNFGDVIPPRHSERTLNWVSEHVATTAAGLFSLNEEDLEEPDGEIQMIIVRGLWQKGKEEKRRGNLDAAEEMLSRSLARARRHRPREFNH